jgi:hypothetical protein
VRVHGKKKICRSTAVTVQADYKNYIPQLKEDFQHICGYCGKYEKVSRKGMEADHFVPDHIDHDRKCDYANLVYSCFTCNRKKGGKWPAKDKNLTHNGKEGFIDPAFDEFDLHLGRDKYGSIVPFTDIGRYMCETAFKFNIRPTREIWQASQIYERWEKLNALKSELLSEDELREFHRVSSELAKLWDYLFGHSE